MKNFFNKFFPNYKFFKLIDINADIFSDSQLIIFDVDNTLFFSETTETKKEIIDWFYKIKNKHKCVCFSNSSSISQRKGKIFDLLGCEVFLSRYKKPSKRLFDEIKKKYNLENGKIFVVGDRVFPDILFGNLNGAITILVSPLSSKEKIIIKIERGIENFALSVLKFFGYN